MSDITWHPMDEWQPVPIGTEVLIEREGSSRLGYFTATVWMMDVRYSCPVEVRWKYEPCLVEPSGRYYRTGAGGAYGFTRFAIISTPKEDA